MRPKFYAFAALLVASAIGAADAPDDIVNQTLSKQHVPGAWLVVIKDGKVVKRKGYGLANVELNVKVTPETMMQTGSIGKMFTSEGIMVLVRDGKLKLTDSLASFFPGAPDWWKPITIRQMLSHTAGIPEYEGEKYTLDLKKEYTEDQMVQFVEKMTPDYKPGEKWSYSNTDYMLLGVIIHKLTGKFYADFLAERVFAPAGMKTIRTLSDTDIIPNRSQGYDDVKGVWHNQDWVSQSCNSTADGTLFATADDFIAWDHALDSYSILPKKYQDQVWQEQKLNDGKGSTYGFAWVIQTIRGHRALWHNGAWQGFVAAYFRFPDQHVSAVLFMNGSNARPEASVVKIAESYFKH
jgi:CubicO group peptidase (beta-lactamase class C family)